MRHQRGTVRCGIDIRYPWSRGSTLRRVSALVVAAQAQCRATRIRIVTRATVAVAPAVEACGDRDGPAPRPDRGRHSRSSRTSETYGAGGTDGGGGKTAEPVRIAIPPWPPSTYRLFRP